MPKIIFSKKRQTLILQENYSMKDLEPLRVFENKMCTVEAVQVPLRVSSKTKMLQESLLVKN